MLKMRGITVPPKKLAIAVVDCKEDASEILAWKSKLPAKSSKSLKTNEVRTASSKNS